MPKPHQIPTRKTDWRYCGHFDFLDFTEKELAFTIQNFPLDPRPHWPKGIPIETPKEKNQHFIWGRAPKRRRHSAEIMNSLGTEGLPVLFFAALILAKQIRKAGRRVKHWENEIGIHPRVDWLSRAERAAPCIIRHYRPEVNVSLRFLQEARKQFSYWWPGLLGAARERYLVDVILTFLWRAGLRGKPDPLNGESMMGPFASNPFPLPPA